MLAAVGLGHLAAHSGDEFEAIAVGLCQNVHELAALRLGMRERLLQMGYEPIGNRPEQFAASAAEDQKRWSAVIAAANISSD